MACRTALYRHYDQTGALLYVGIAMSVVRRTNEHGKYARGWQYVTEIKIEWFEDRSAAEAAEVVAIRTEKPTFNSHHNRPELQEAAPLPVLPGQYPSQQASYSGLRTDDERTWMVRESEAAQLLGIPRAEFREHCFRVGMPIFQLSSRIWSVIRADLEHEAERLS